METKLDLIHKVKELSKEYDLDVLETTVSFLVYESKLQHKESVYQRKQGKSHDEIVNNHPNIMCKAYRVFERYIKMKYKISGD